MGRFPPDKRAVKATEGEIVEGVDFVFPAGEALPGRVVDSSGHPVPGAAVATEPQYASDPYGEARTDGEGAFRITGLRPGRVDLSATREGFQPARTWTEIPATVL